jgi:outer membrane protein
MKKLLAVSVFFFLAMSGGMAQKYGHLNFGNLVAAMPETKSADEALEKYQRELVAKGEEMAKNFQEKYGKFVAEVQSGDLSPVQQQTKQQELRQEQEQILQYEEELRELVEAKREELLSPIFEKAQEAVQTIAKEGGYTMVFDTSLFNALLFAQESDDLMLQVMAKLGLQ